MSKNVIQDGYTKDGYIAAHERLHDELWFKYRPMYGGGPGYFTSTVFRSLDAGHQAAEEAKAIATNLVSWSEAGPNGQLLPITTENVFRLPVLVRQRLLNIIAGYDSSDLNPSKSVTPDKDEEIERMLKAHQTGTAPGMVALEEDSKN